MERGGHDLEGHAHFVSFSCCRRRGLLGDDRAKGIGVHFPAEELRKTDGSRAGFEIMADHVHALLRYGKPGMLSSFIQQRKRKSSHRLKEFIGEHLPACAAAMDLREPIRRAGFHDFNVFSLDKAGEKLEYMHNNPVGKGLVTDARLWRFSSAGWYLPRRSVGVEIVALS